MSDYPKQQDAVSGDDLGAALDRASAAIKARDTRSVWTTMIGLAAGLSEHGVPLLAAGLPEHVAYAEIERGAHRAAKADRARENGKKGGAPRKQERNFLWWWLVRHEMRSGAKSTLDACKRVARQELKQEQERNPTHEAVAQRAEVIRKAIERFDGISLGNLIAVMFGIDAERLRSLPVAIFSEECRK